jgi:hypothetical protein
MGGARRVRRRACVSGHVGEDGGRPRPPWPAAAARGASATAAAPSRPRAPPGDCLPPRLVDAIGAHAARGEQKRRRRSLRTAPIRPPPRRARRARRRARVRRPRGAWRATQSRAHLRGVDRAPRSRSGGGRAASAPHPTPPTPPAPAPPSHPLPPPRHSAPPPGRRRRSGRHYGLLVGHGRGEKGKSRGQSASARAAAPAAAAGDRDVERSAGRGPRRAGPRAPPPADPLAPASPQGFLKSWGMILVSEIGDKTFFIAAIMAMKHSQRQVGEEEGASGGRPESDGLLPRSASSPRPRSLPAPCRPWPS